MWLRTRLYLLMAVMFAIMYAILAMVARSAGIAGFLPYIVLAGFMLFIQYMVGPALVQFSMKVKYLAPGEHDELRQMVAELATRAGIPRPRVGISRVPVPNAFAFGRWGGDGRVCVTEALLGLLSRDELRAVLGHEISHLRHRDVAIITMLSVIPMILWYMAWHLMFAGNRRSGGGNVALIGLVAFLLYFVTNLLVLYGSRIREYYADLGSVRLGSAPQHLASALYKLVYGGARVPKESLKRIEGYKAFFASDPSRAMRELRDLTQVDQDMSGTIDQAELMSLRTKEVHLGFSDKLMEVMSTHPNMVKRIKHLSGLAYRDMG